MNSGGWAFLGSVLGTLITGGIAIRIAYTQNKQERRRMGFEYAASHMSNFVFDKYVQFCEEYINTVHKAMDLTIKNGANREILNYAAELYKIRRSRYLWITSEVAKKLENFEFNLRKMGASAGYVEDTNSIQNSTDHQEQIKQKYMCLCEFLNIKEWQGQQVNQGNSIQAIEDTLRSMLEIEQLATLRRAVISQAVQDVKPA